MIDRPIIPRERAVRDAREAVDHDLAEAGEEDALGFIDALERAYQHIARHPAAGSPRDTHELDLPGLRCWPLQRFSHLVFFVEHPDHVDVLRILHSRSDIPAWMMDAEGR